MEKNIWIDLTKKYCDKLILDSYGFTVPFIIGIEREFNNRENFTIRNIFEDLKVTNDIFTISNCDDLDEIIIGEHKKSYPNVNSLKRIENIIINFKELEEVNLTEQLISFFEDKYNSKILEKEFSKNYYTHRWSYFDEQDNKLIKKLLNTY
jgi:hypothetical protein